MKVCDTNIFLRLAEKDSPLRVNALRAIRKMRSAGDVLCFTPQIVAEFWNVCTRPAAVRGGLGLSVEATERKVQLIEKHFQLLPDNLATFEEWRRLVLSQKISGVAVHDAKLAASCRVYGIREILTFNAADFVRYKFLTVIDPKTT